MHPNFSLNPIFSKIWLESIPGFFKIEKKKFGSSKKLFLEVPLKKNILFWGGIAVGNHFNAKNDERFVLMGNGLFRVVKLEGKVVHNTVIGINNKTIEQMRSICELEFEEEQLFGLKNSK